MDPGKREAVTSTEIVHNVLTNKSLDQGRKNYVISFGKHRMTSGRPKLNQV